MAEPNSLDRAYRLVAAEDDLIDDSRTSGRTDAPWIRKSWLPLLIAATLILIVGIASQRVIAPERPPAVGPAPAPGPPAPRTRLPFVLALSGTRAEGIAFVSIPQDIDDLEIQIDLADEARFTSFTARVIQSAGREVWHSGEGDAPKLTPDGVLVVTVPVSPGVGEPGPYELMVLGRAATGPPRLVGTIPFSVRRP